MERQPPAQDERHQPGRASRSCVPAEDLEKYAGGKSLYGWIVGEAEEYETPSPLAEFGLTRPPMSWQYIEIPDDKEE